MGDKTYTDGLNYDLVKRAVHGEKDALKEILRIYEPFHNALVTREVLGPDGKIHKEIDEDLHKNQICIMFPLILPANWDGKAIL